MCERETQLKARIERLENALRGMLQECEALKCHKIATHTNQWGNRVCPAHARFSTRRHPIPGAREAIEALREDHVGDVNNVPELSGIPGQLKRG